MTKDEIIRMTHDAIVGLSDFDAMRIQEIVLLALNIGAAAELKPLSDGKIGRLCGRFDARHSVAIGIARAIEKAHGIGSEA